MSFTDNCDIFASFHEDGFNRIISHIKNQRPSLFNYGTEFLASNEELLCQAIDSHPIVSDSDNPAVTIVDPLPIPGTNYGMNFAVQFVDVNVDFHPGNEFDLPPELDPPLKEQRMAIKLELCGGMGCPRKDVVDELIPPPNAEAESKPRDIVALPPGRELICFCLDAHVTGGIRIATYESDPHLEPFMDDIEIVDIKPVELEDSLECYIMLVLKLAVLPGLRILLRHAPLNLTQGATDFFPQPTNVVLSPTPTSTDVPNNPAIEKNLLKVFIDTEVV